MGRLWMGLFLLAGLGIRTEASAQNPQYAFRVTFTDKNTTSFSLSQPSSFLSQRALDRRSRYECPIDSSDLPVARFYVDSVLKITGGQLHLSSRWFNYCVVLMEDSGANAQIRELSFVAGSKQVAYYPSGSRQRPTGDEVPSSTGNGYKPTRFDADFYAAAWTQIQLCNGALLHESGNRGQGMLIAVMDVGYSGVPDIPAFDSMRQHNRLADTWNFIYDTSFVFDYGAHGSQVLSCMAAYQPGVFVGTAPEASYALYATDHLTTEQAIEQDNWVAAAERADSIGADLINSALGYNTFDNPEDSYTYSDLNGQTTLLARAANIATRKGILVVTSAGNEGNTTWQYLLSPGDADSALTVGSVNASRQPALSTGKGPNAAGILKPNVSAMGVQAAVINGQGQVTTASGASFATPIIAGLSACLLQGAPEQTPLQIRTLIESVAHRYGNPDTLSGYGVPDFGKAWLQMTGLDKHSFVDENYSRIYPNPATHEITIVLQNQAIPTAMIVAVCNLSGHVLLQAENNGPSLKLNIASLPAGIYLLKVVTKQGVRIQKWIKR